MNAGPRRLVRVLVCALMLVAGAVLTSPSTAEPSEPVLRPFSVHDLNRDGYLDRDEYRALRELRRLRHQRRGRIPPQPAPAFDDVDRNGDRLIGEEELTDVLRHKMYRYRHRGPRWHYPPPGQ